MIKDPRATIQSVLVISVCKFSVNAAQVKRDALFTLNAERQSER